MAAYIILILLPSFFAFLNPRRISYPSWILVFVIYVLFVGLRYEVGPDWGQYIQLHAMASELSLGEIAFLTEPFSYTLFWFSELFGTGVYFTNIVAAIIMMCGVYSFSKHTCNPWISLLAASPYFIFVVGMSGIRQIMAAGVILILLANWNQISLKRRGAYILGAAFFHTSALVNSLFIIAQLRLHLFYRLFFGGIILAITIFLGSKLAIFSENISRYEQSYISDPQGAASLGSIFHIAMIAIPAFLAFIFRRRIAPYISKPQLLSFGLYATLGVIVLNFFSSTAASRLTIYLYFVPMMVYPAFTYILGKRNMQIAILGIVILHVLLLAGWLSLANNASAYLPYQNVIFK